MGNLLETVTCSSPSANRLKVLFTFKVPQLIEDYTINFKVLNVRNAPNTKLTNPFFDIEAHDSSGF